MNVQINEAGANHPSGHVQPLDPGGRLPGGVGPDRGDFSINDEDVRGRVAVVGGVDDPPAGQEQRVHGVKIHAGRLTRQAPGV